MIHKIKHIIFLAVTLTAMVSCKSYLTEEPKSLLTAKYLETSSGVNAALNSCYSDLRYVYGGESALTVTCAGTDEWQRGPDGSANFNTYTSSMGADGGIGGIWNWGYTSINTENAVIQFAPTCGMLENDWKRVVAEAKYLRAAWYFIIVQTFGDCPLNVDFISVPSTEAYRDSSFKVYKQIIQDLEEAKLVLPAKAAQTGRATSAAAYHLLSKVYLTRATKSYAEATDYNNAYINAMQLINNAGTYGLALLPDFASVFTPRNEHNSEVIFTVERSADILYNDMDPNTNGNKNNRSSFFFRPNYSSWTSGLVRDIPNGRPWHRVRPTNYLLSVSFAERSDDTRYDKTFQTAWLVNDVANVPDKTFKTGDTAAWLPGVENPRPAKALKVYKPSQYYGNMQADGTLQTVTSVYPSMKKYDDIDRPTVADASVRPFIVYRFAETYLIAAEAAMYLNNASKSVELLNVVRTRAAYKATRSDAENTLAVQRMINKTPNMTDKDAGITFILEERSRELAGEYMRFWDLCRTKTESGEVQLLHRVNNLSPACPATGLVRSFHVLRPIPQSQRDFTTNGFPNNPGY